jgi:hypothetical protein
MTGPRQETVVEGTADLVDLDTGLCRYEWEAGDTDLPDGQYSAAFIVDLPSSKSVAVPNTSALTVTIGRR